MTYDFFFLSPWQSFWDEYAHGYAYCNTGNIQRNEQSWKITMHQVLDLFLRGATASFIQLSSCPTPAASIIIITLVRQGYFPKIPTTEPTWAASHRRSSPEFNCCRRQHCCSAGIAIVCTRPGSKVAYWMWRDDIRVMILLHLALKASHDKTAALAALLGQMITPKGAPLAEG